MVILWNKITGCRKFDFYLEYLTHPISLLLCQNTDVQSLVFHWTQTLCARPYLLNPIRMIIFLTLNPSKYLYSFILNSTIFHYDSFYVYLNVFRQLHFILYPQRTIFITLSYLSLLYFLKLINVLMSYILHA